MAAEVDCADTAGWGVEEWDATAEHAEVATPMTTPMATSQRRRSDLTLYRMSLSFF